MHLEALARIRIHDKKDKVGLRGKKEEFEPHPDYVHDTSCMQWV